jgi:signal transduction histidine kinase/DNA-binding response OmpR family regulator
MQIAINSVALTHVVGALATALLTLSGAKAFANEYRHVGDPIATIYSIEQHQSGNQVWGIDQMPDGQMVFATANGLTSWDGENWQHGSSPNNTRMRGLTIWQDGNIYAGAVGELGYFVKSARGEFEFTVIPSGHLNPDFGQTRGVNSNTDMVVYSTDQAVFVWDGKKLNIIEHFNAQGSRVFAINDQLLVNDEQKLYQIVNDGPSPTAIEKPWHFPTGINIKSLFLNAKNNVILVSNMRGIYRLENNEFVQIVSPETLPANSLYGAVQGSDGYYYFNSTLNGLMVFSENFELLRHYQQNDGIGLSTTYAIFQDRQNSIWLGGLPNITVFQPPHLRSRYRSDTGTLDFENIFEVNGRMFFSGTGFYQLSYPANPAHGPVFKQVPNFNSVVMDMVAVENELLVATENGVYVFDFDPSAIGNMPSNPRLITTEDFVNDLARVAGQPMIYATVGNKLSRLYKSAGQWLETTLFEDKSGTEYLAVESLPNGRHAVWVSTEQQELYRAADISIDGKVGSLLTFNTPSAPLGNEHVLPFIYNNTIYIGTQNGVFSYTADLEQSFTAADVLPQSMRSPNKDVFRTLEDDKGRLWYHAGRDTGVVYANNKGVLTSQESMLRPYNNSGTRGLAYFDNAIWFGVASGNIYRMSDKNIEAEPAPAHVAIRYIKNIVGNKLMSTNTSIEPISTDDNSIRIGYALPEYASQRKTEYRSKISGQGQANWTQWSNEASKDFPLLAGGKYTFEVQARDAWGRDSYGQQVFAVAYPWYLTTAAWAIYAVLLILLVIGSVHIGQTRRNIRLERQNSLLESTVAQRTTEIRSMVSELEQQQLLKDRFFANVSHEFRTPLTLTIGPLEQVLKHHRRSMGAASQALASTALSNAKKMLALISQVLDINRLETGKFPLRVSEYDLADLLRVNCERFLPWARQHRQNIRCINCENPYLLYFDQDQMDKCISNLLSNAIKYSGDNSQILIELICRDEKVGIRISDNGIGLSALSKNRVFERFYQEQSALHTTAPGAGIGLSLVKELTALHQGEIELVAQPQKGCQFTLWFKTGKSHFDSEQLIEPLYLPVKEQTQTSSATFEQITILIVDDNAELRQFITQCLSSTYHVLQAENGEQGLISAIKNLPDVIISDVTMPLMSGLELSKKLKANGDTCNIPILLLSAQTAKRDIVAGFQSGADDYLTKPFDTSELYMRINALYINRKNKVVDAPTLSAELSLLADDNLSFAAKLNQHILANIQDRHFSLEHLAEFMFMSKETLRRKCKQTNDLSPSAYISLCRIQQAKLLLEKHRLSVGEVADAVGFDSIAYFSKCFKKHYGFSPSNLMK